jgi:bacillithiol system protein YtxJ
MWLEISEAKQLEEIKEMSKHSPILIFKHSTRCGISSMAKNRLERSWNEKDVSRLQPYILDLVRYRNISDAVASEFQVMHESPQVLLIAAGQCIYEASHLEIDYEEIMNNV